MLVEQLTIYDSWKQEIPSIPPRSRLYQLVPVGIETSHVESLTSFIARLAEAHCLLPKTLITEIIAPHIQQTFVKQCTSRGLGALFERARTINSSGKTAKDFIRAIEALTCHQNLQFLTLITWSDVLSSKALLRSNKAWCSACYQEWLSSANIVYEPLLWSLKTVKICSKHRILLSESCPHCHQQLPLLSWHSRLGFCSSCHDSLINFALTDVAKIKLVVKPELDKSIWITNSLEELLALSPSLQRIPSKDIFKNNLCFAVNIVSGGSLTNFASLLKVSKTTLWGWFRGKTFPSLDTLLKLAWLMKISLVDLLTQEIQTTDFEGLSTNLISCPTKQKRSSPRQFNYHHVQQVLLNVLNQDDIIPTIKEIALDLGYSRRLVARHFPDLCHAIVAKRRSLQKANYTATIQKSCQRVREAVLDLYSRGEYPSEARVCKLIAQPGFLRYKQVRAALREARHELGLEP